MDLTRFNKTFDRDEQSFSGYFSDKAITDIDKALIAAEITEDELTKTSRQLMTTFEEMAGMVQAFGIVFFMLIIYLLSRIIIEKNAQSISMLLTIPAANALISRVIPLALVDYSWYFFYYVPFTVFVKMALLGILGYGVIAFLQTRKVKRIPLDVALKNVE